MLRRITGPVLGRVRRLSLTGSVGKLKEKDSFTLIELLIVIAIIGILAAVVVLILNPQQLLAQGRERSEQEELVSGMLT